VIRIDIKELTTPVLEFGGPGEFSDPKVGLRDAGPFDLRFGAAHREQIRLGLVGPSQILKAARHWFERCQRYVRSPNQSVRQPGFPGFEEVFKRRLVLDERWIVEIRELNDALDESNSQRRFARVLDLYASAIGKLGDLEVGRPDVVVCCLPDEVVRSCFSVSRNLTGEETAAAKVLRRRTQTRQLSLFDLLEDQGSEELEEDLVYRDFRRALKARAMRVKMPIQIATGDLFVDGERNQDAATRAWNSSVAIYYKAGGIPWRLRIPGPETCFVGVSFHHFRTTRRHLVVSSIAQAFSSQGEGFAIRGQSVEWDRAQGRQVHLTEKQAFQLAEDILSEYRDRTGGSPVRLVIHKTSAFEASEGAGFMSALREVPVVEFVTLIETPLRLVRFGNYPPKWGTLLLINEAAAYLFTSGFMAALGTYPGPHIPAPIRIKTAEGASVVQVAQDVLGLTRMNWNTASLTVSQPVTLSFARRIGGIMDEYGDREPKPPSSFRFYI
jgi:hypothetical protein